jgi:glucose-1-phosphate adenylyltransferase
VTVGEYTTVQNAILMNNVKVGKDCRITRTIIDKSVCVPDNTVVGYSLEDDKRRFTVTDSGIVVIGKGTAF